MKWDEIKRFLELKRKLFGIDMFVEVDSNNPEWTEYNELAAKHQDMIRNVIGNK